MLNYWQQARCSFQAQIFSESLNRFSCGSKYFLFRFLFSHLEENFDIDPYYVDMVDDAFLEIEKEFPSLHTKKGEKLSKDILHWLGYLYRAWQFLSNKKTSTLVRLLPIDQAIELYDVYHTFDIEYAIKRIEEDLVFFDAKSDYLIYQQILTSN